MAHIGSFVPAERAVIGRGGSFYSFRCRSSSTWPILAVFVPAERAVIGRGGSFYSFRWRSSSTWPILAVLCRQSGPLLVEAGLFIPSSAARRLHGPYWQFCAGRAAVIGRGGSFYSFRWRSSSTWPILAVLCRQSGPLLVEAGLFIPSGAARRLHGPYWQFCAGRAGRYW